MNSSESASAVLGLFLLLQLAGFLALLISGFYLVNCLARIVSSLERLAEAAEERLLRANFVAPPPQIPMPTPQPIEASTPAPSPAPSSPAPPSLGPLSPAPPRDFPVVSGSDYNAPADRPPTSADDSRSL